MKKNKNTTPAPTSGANKIVINPPEKKVKGAFNEAFLASVLRRMIDEKTQIVLQAKAARAELPEQVLYKVFVRGLNEHKTSQTNHTESQYAMNRVNSFLAGGAALREDFDLIPVMERVGMKGTGGAMRPHIKREKSPFNNKVIFYVLDSKGHVKFSTQDELAAKKHLATKYNSYMEGFIPEAKKMKGEDPCWDDYEMVGKKIKNGREVPNCVPKNEEFAADVVEAYKTPAWSRKEGKNPEGGLNRKGIASYRAANPGSKLSLAVTTKPSKLKKGSKAYNRRKSFCARMSGVDGPMEKDGKPTRKALALRKWNC